MSRSVWFEEPKPMSITALRRASKVCEGCGCTYYPDAPVNTKKWDSSRYHSRRCANAVNRSLARDAAPVSQEKRLVRFEGGVPVYRVEMDGAVPRR